MSMYLPFLDHKDHITQCFLIKREINTIKKGSMGMARQRKKTGADQMLYLYFPFKSNIFPAQILFIM